MDIQQVQKIIFNHLAACPDANYFRLSYLFFEAFHLVYVTTYMHVRLELVYGVSHRGASREREFFYLASARVHVSNHHFLFCFLEVLEPQGKIVVHLPPAHKIFSDIGPATSKK